MYVKVRTVDGKTNITVTVSKLTSVDELRSLVEEKLKVEKSRQRFFYRGKQLEDGYTLFDYDIRLNDVVQLMIKEEPASIEPSIKSAIDSSVSDRSDKPTVSVQEPVLKQNAILSKYFRVGDLVDVRNISCGAWFEGKIVGFVQSKVSLEDDTKYSTSKVEKSAFNCNELEKDSTDSNKCSTLKEDGNSAMNCNGLEKDSTDSSQCSTSKEDGKSVMNCNGLEKEATDSSNMKQSPNDEDLQDNASNYARYSPQLDDGIIYQVWLNEYEGDPPLEVILEHVRPRARNMYDFDDLKIGKVVMANFNIESPKSRGHWYDVCIKGLHKTRTVKEIDGCIYASANNILLDTCKIVFCDQIFKIEKTKPINERTTEEDKLMQTESSVTRQNAPNCARCHDNPRVKCKECSCHVCGGKDDPATQILCDECNLAYHIRCLDPPLESVPDCDEWYCPDCKNDENEIVRAGEKLKESKKKTKMPCQNSKSSRDWGKGMACVGRTKECTLVPPNHYGPIPGVEVGTAWLFRVQVSESGIHRPPVGGIHGRETDGAYSIVLSGGYEDDVDNGDEFLYTGSGGRDLSGNKRTAEQSCDQTLTRLNKALALNCNIPLSNKGGEAKNWKGGKPVRVVRNYKLRKHSKYAPEVGNRYDGIYKVVKYYPEKGKSGFVVWRYLLRRDDNTPAPWTTEGKKHIKLHGLEKPFAPEGYLEANEDKLKLEMGAPNEKNSTKSKNSKKRTQDVLKNSVSQSPEKKKQKTMEYKLEASIKKLIDEDINIKLWSSCNEFLKDGKQTYIAKVAETFMCICCQELVFKPITTECKHNLCKSCLHRSFAAEVYTCPFCRHDLGEKYSMKVNETLSAILCKLFPGYEHGR